MRIRNPSTFKNALDWASRPFPDNCLRRKPVVVIGASTGLFGARWAQAELRKVLKTIGASVLETERSVASAHEAFTADGHLRDPRLAAALCGITSSIGYCEMPPDACMHACDLVPEVTRRLLTRHAGAIRLRIASRR